MICWIYGQHLVQRAPNLAGILRVIFAFCKICPLGSAKSHQIRVIKQYKTKKNDCCIQRLSIVIVDGPNREVMQQNQGLLWRVGRLQENRQSLDCYNFGLFRVSDGTALMSTRIFDNN